MTAARQPGQVAGGSTGPGFLSSTHFGVTGPPIGVDFRAAEARLYSLGRAAPVVEVTVAARKVTASGMRVDISVTGEPDATHVNTVEARLSAFNARMVGRTRATRCRWQHSRGGAGRWSGGQWGSHCGGGCS